jgi:hypothetical protein
MGCMMFLMLGGILAAVGVYLGSLVSYSVGLVVMMAGYLSVFSSALVAMVIFLFS